MRIETLTTTEELTAAARSRAYRLLADGFSFPDRVFFASLCSGAYAHEVEGTLRALPHAFDLPESGLTASVDYLDFQAEYLRLFDVGLGIPPCPLYSGIYRGGRKAVMEELTRFYNFFGLSIEQGAGELPDHVTTELEFMHFLAFKELAALHQGDDPAPYRRAQVDFLERQLISWLPALEERLGSLDAPSFYATLVRATNAFAHVERAYLQESLRSSLAVLEGV